MNSFHSNLQFYHQMGLNSQVSVWLLAVVSYQLLFGLYRKHISEMACNAKEPWQKIVTLHLTKLVCWANRWILNTEVWWLNLSQKQSWSYRWFSTEKAKNPQSWCFPWAAHKMSHEQRTSVSESLQHRLDTIRNVTGAFFLPTPTRANQSELWNVFCRFLQWARSAC